MNCVISSLVAHTLYSFVCIVVVLHLLHNIELSYDTLAPINIRNEELIE